jgi:hypothetical protein
MSGILPTDRDPDGRHGTQNAPKVLCIFCPGIQGRRGARDSNGAVLRIGASARHLVGPWGLQQYGGFETGLAPSYFWRGQLVERQGSAPPWQRNKPFLTARQSEMGRGTCFNFFETQLPPAQQQSTPGIEVPGKQLASDKSPFYVITELPALALA